MTRAQTTGQLAPGATSPVAAIRQSAITNGFAACGIAGRDAAPATMQRLEDWIAQGCHGDMMWMATRAHERGRPTHLWPDVRSIVMLGMAYTPGHDPLALAVERSRARISVYAQGSDYHDIVKRALKAVARDMMHITPDQALKVFVDTAPVMEKPLAEAAGIGWQGKHSNLVSRKDGSWLFLGAIYTTMDLPADAPAPDRCGSCTACHAACPTDAFPAPYQLDARRCISYLTIEHKGPIPPEFRRPMGNRIYGCDDCLAACPWNKFADTARRHRSFLPRAELVAPRIADLLTLDDDGFRALFSGSPIKRIGRARMVRNAAIAAGNSGDAAFVGQLDRLRHDADAVVAEAAAWAINELTSAQQD